MSTIPKVKDAIDNISYGSVISTRKYCWLIPSYITDSVSIANLYSKSLLNVDNLNHENCWDEEEEITIENDEDWFWADIGTGKLELICENCNNIQGPSWIEIHRNIKIIKDGGDKFIPSKIGKHYVYCHVDDINK